MASTTPTNYGARAMEATLQQTGQEFLLSQLTYSSAPLARNMLHKIGLDELVTTAPFTLVDLGCGLGVVAPLLNEMIPREIMAESKVLCVDASEVLIDSVKGRIEREGWVGAEARVVDAQKTGLETESFSHVVSNLVYHTVSDSEAALKESLRILTPGGTLAFTTWHALNGGAFPPMRFAFNSPQHFPPTLLSEKSNPNFEFPAQTSPWGRWGDVDWIRQTLRSQGLQDINVDVLAHMWPMESVAHYMRAFGAIVDMMAKSVLGKECVERLGGLEEVRKRITECLEGSQEFGAKEGWTLTWVSIVAWGRKPMHERYPGSHESI